MDLLTFKSETSQQRGLSCKVQEAGPSAGKGDEVCGKAFGFCSGKKNIYI